MIVTCVDTSTRCSIEKSLGGPPTDASLKGMEERQLPQVAAADTHSGPSKAEALAAKPPLPAPTEIAPSPSDSGGSQLDSTVASAPIQQGDAVAKGNAIDAVATAAIANSAIAPPSDEKPIAPQEPPKFTSETRSSSTQQSALQQQADSLKAVAREKSPAPVVASPPHADSAASPVAVSGHSPESVKQQSQKQQTPALMEKLSSYQPSPPPKSTPQEAQHSTGAQKELPTAPEPTSPEVPPKRKSRLDITGATEHTATTRQELEARKAPPHDPAMEVLSASSGPQNVPTSASGNSLPAPAGSNTPASNRSIPDIVGAASKGAISAPPSRSPDKGSLPKLEPLQFLSNKDQIASPGKDPNDNENENEEWYMAPLAKDISPMSPTTASKEMPFSKSTLDRQELVF